MDDKKIAELIQKSENIIDLLNELIDETEDLKEKNELTKVSKKLWKYFYELRIFQNLDKEFLDEIKALGFEVPGHLYQYIKEGRKFKNFEATIGITTLQIKEEWGRYRFEIEQKYNPALFNRGNCIISYGRKETFLTDLKRVIVRKEILLKLAHESQIPYYEDQLAHLSSDLSFNTKILNGLNKEIVAMRGMENYEAIPPPEDKKVIKESKKEKIIQKNE
jgi:hypothetical protein